MQELLTQIWEEHRLTVLFVTHDVEEAVYLSDRIVVMGIGPGRIMRTFNVDLERPRREEIMRARLSWIFSAASTRRSARLPNIPKWHSALINVRSAVTSRKSNGRKSNGSAKRATAILVAGTVSGAKTEPQRQ
jgi:ABC-type proline/glycine betaine transport system ATPase subunit